MLFPITGSIDFYQLIILPYLQLIYSFLKKIINNLFRSWGLGIGDWGLGIGPNPQSPIPNPPIPTFLI
jgi:hypothetical protein